MRFIIIYSAFTVLVFKWFFLPNEYFEAVLNFQYKLKLRGFLKPPWGTWAWFALEKFEHNSGIFTLEIPYSCALLWLKESRLAPNPTPENFQFYLNWMIMIKYSNCILNWIKDYHIYFFSDVHFFDWLYNYINIALHRKKANFNRENIFWLQSI